MIHLDDNARLRPPGPTSFYRRVLPSRATAPRVPNCGRFTSKPR
jgi:hypothetical protein